MESIFVLAICAMTSLVVFAASVRWLGWPSAALRQAFRRTLETVGLVMLFYLLNVAVGAMLALLTRSTGIAFISLYINTDLSILAFAVFQGLVFEFWWRRE